jgi:hypothetical protein
MLNLAQMQAQIKSADLSQAAALNLNTLVGLNEAYRRLKALGWSALDAGGQIASHPTDRVPVFRLGAAALRRNKAAASDWLMEVDGQIYEVMANTINDLIELTERVQAMVQHEIENRADRHRFAGWHAATPGEVERAQAKQAGQPSLAEQSQAALDRIVAERLAEQRRTALPASAAESMSISDMLGYEEEIAAAEAKQAGRPSLARQRIETGRPQGGGILDHEVEL